jgi:hypothetical protein
MSKTQSKLGITIDPVPSCCCWVNIYYNFNEEYPNGAAQILSEGCLDREFQWQYLASITGSWVDIPLSDPGFGLDPTIYYPFAVGALGAGLYRVKYFNDTCCDEYSNLLEFYIA